MRPGMEQITVATTASFKNSKLLERRVVWQRGRALVFRFYWLYESRLTYRMMVLSES